MVTRRAFTLNALAVAGALVCAGSVIRWSLMGAWPFHDTVTNWLAGRHLLEGAEVYGRVLGTFLSFVFAPPWAVIYAPLSYLPYELVAAAEFVGQILALRFVAGSWRNAGLVSWLPFVPRELVTGNFDLIMAAAIYAAARRVRWSGAALALFGLAKFSPLLMLVIADRRQWRGALLALGVLVIVSLPWLPLWTAWAGNLIASRDVPVDLPLLPRLPFVAALLLIRRPWSVAMAAGLATPAFYYHSPVLLLPGLRLLWEARKSPATETPQAT